MSKQPVARAIFPDHAETRLKEEHFDVQTGFTERQPDLARKRRRARLFACACSSPENAGKMLPFQVSGTHSSLNLDFFVAGMRKGDVIDVLVRTLDDILAEANVPIPIDLMSIDVESHEIEVLNGLTLSHWRPRLILIEDLAFDLRIHRLLQSRGYKWVRRTGLNGWYVPVDVDFPVSAFGRWRFLRKHYLGVPFRLFREAKRKLRERMWARLARISGSTP